MLEYLEGSQGICRRMESQKIGSVGFDDWDRWLGLAYAKAGFDTSILLLAFTASFVPVSRLPETSDGTASEQVVAVEHTQSASSSQ